MCHSVVHARQRLSLLACLAGTCACLTLAPVTRAGDQVDSPEALVEQSQESPSDSTISSEHSIDDGDQTNESSSRSESSNTSAELADLAELDDSLDLMFADFDVIVSASRTTQSAQLASAAVSTLSGEFLHYSGVTRIEDAFDFALGVDILRVDRSRSAIGVRGLHQIFSDRTLFLQNGRNISNALYGGIDLQQHALFIENIERIEFLRGPGSGAWGANAFNGVINVIEKSPRDTAGTLTQYTITEYGDQQGFFRVGDSDESLSWRLSGQFDHRKSSNDAVGGPDLSEDDWSRSRQFSFDAVYDIDASSAFEFGGSYTHLDRGTVEELGLNSEADIRVDRGSAYAKLIHTLESGSELSLNWYGSYSDESQPTLWRASMYDTTFDGQFTFRPTDEHEVTVGGTVRYINFETTPPDAGDFLESQTEAETWIGGFISNRWQVTDRWTVEGQARYDWYSGTEGDFAGRLAVLRLLDPDGNHVLRFGAARSFRTPQSGVRDFELRTQEIEIPGLPVRLFGLNFDRPGEVNNEQLYSLELGYAGKLTDNISLNSDLYYQRYYDLTGIAAELEPEPQVGRQFFSVGNVGNATAWGFETELKYQDESNSFAVWYAFNDLQFSSGVENVRAFAPAPHKVGLRARTHLTDALVLSANYRFMDQTPAIVAFGIPDIRDNHRLDITLAIKDPSSTVEILLGVADVFDETDTPINTQSNPFGDPLETPGQSFFARVQIEF